MKIILHVGLPGCNDPGRRTDLCSKLSRSASSLVEQLPTAVKAGATLAPLFFLAAGLGGAFLALKTLR